MGHPTDPTPAPTTRIAMAASLLGVMVWLAACDDQGTGSQPDAAVDAEVVTCQGVACSGHGSCAELPGGAGGAQCDCHPSYEASGLACVRAPLPSLSCQGDWVTHALQEPVILFRRQARRAAPTPTAFRGRTPSARRPAAKLGSRLLRHAAQRAVATVAYRLVAGRASTPGALPYGPNHHLILEHHGPLDREAAKALAADPAVLRVDEAPAEPVPLCHIGRRSVHSEEVQDIELATDPPSYRGLSGRGIIAAVVDTGVDPGHPDFRYRGPGGVDLGTRVVGDPVRPGESHGTAVAGILGGSGFASGGVTVRDVTGTPYLFRGNAPEVATIVSVQSGPHPWTTAFITHGAQLSNHSYVHSAGDYDMGVALADKIIRFGETSIDATAPPRVSVWAAANSGMGPYGDGLPLRGYYSALAPSKNALCVGGSNANDDTKAAAASMGPTLDGRIKPDLVAPGYKNYRPPAGIRFDIDEIRLVADATSGLSDLVWSFDTAGDFEQWSFGARLLAPTVSGGSLSATSISGNGNQDGLNFSFSDSWGQTIAATAFTEVQVTLRLDPGALGSEHHYPWFWVFSWDRSGNGDLDSHSYPQYPEADRNPGWQTRTVTLRGHNRWTGDIGRLRVWPAPYDDRVVAPDLNGGYGGSGGTSFAAPVAAGVVALLMEQLEADHGYDISAAPPLPSSFKALLIHTATDLIHQLPWLRDRPNPDTGAPVLYHRGPDFATGYGLLNAQRAVSLLDAHNRGPHGPKWLEQRVTDEGEEHVYAFPVSDDFAGLPLKVTVAWDDYFGDPTLAATAIQLVNDLDLVLIDPDGQAHSPWLLDPLPIDATPAVLWEGYDPIDATDIVGARRCQGPSYWQGAATRSCEDHRNNVEQVLVDAPIAGWWMVRLRAHTLPQPPQPYSLVVSQACVP